MSKFSVTAVVVFVLVAVIGYLAFDPTAARDATNWIKRQVGDEVPDSKSLRHPGYTPVVPGK